MNAVRVEAVVESDGILHITDLPYHKGDRVEAVIVLSGETKDRTQELARQRFLDRARRSQVRSSGPFPSRDAIHERD